MSGEHKKELEEAFKSIKNRIQSQPVNDNIKRYANDIERYHHRWADAKNAQERLAVMLDGGALAGLFRMNLQMNTFTDLEKDVMRAMLKHIVETVKANKEEHKELKEVEDKIAKLEGKSEKAEEVEMPELDANKKTETLKVPEHLKEIAEQDKLSNRIPTVEPKSNKAANKKKLAEEMGFTGKLTEEQDSLLDILADDKATEAEKEAARKIFADGDSQSLEVGNGGHNPTSKYISVPPKHASAEAKEIYALKQDGVHRVEVDGEYGFYRKEKEVLNYDSNGKDKLDRAVIEKMLEHAQKIGYEPVTISGNPKLVELAMEICKQKGIDYQLADATPTRGATNSC